MKIVSIDINATTKNAKALLDTGRSLSQAVKSMMEILLLLVVLLVNRLNLNSTNSSKPPSSDAKGASETEVSNNCLKAWWSKRPSRKNP